jgi:hypothetical protein
VRTAINVWSKFANEISEALAPNENHKKNPHIMDTYPKLLFKLGKREEAIKNQEEAILANKKWGDSSTKLEDVLEKMKTGKL